MKTAPSSACVPMAPAFPQIRYVATNVLTEAIVRTCTRAWQATVVWRNALSAPVDLFPMAAVQVWIARQPVHKLLVVVSVQPIAIVRPRVRFAVSSLMEAIDAAIATPSALAGFPPRKRAARKAALSHTGMVTTTVKTGTSQPRASSAWCIAGTRASSYASCRTLERNHRCPPPAGKFANNGWGRQQPGSGCPLTTIPPG